MTPCKHFGSLFCSQKKEERLCLTLPLHVNIFRILQVIFLFLVFVDFMATRCVVCLQNRAVQQVYFSILFDVFSLIVFLVPVVLT